MLLCGCGGLAAFSALGDLLLEFPALVRSAQFVLVPGSADPVATALLPRPPLPSVVAGALRAKLGGRVHLASNPCRIIYFSQELVVFRDDIMARMLRNTVVLKHHAHHADLKKYVSNSCSLPTRASLYPR
jgi:DNA polymerase epsilon subunit 2